jgi:hypothetical protein
MRAARNLICVTDLPPRKHAAWCNLGDSMAKKSMSAAAQLSAPLAPPSGASVNPFGPTEQRKITRSHVAESVFTLSDGTKLRVKPVVGDVRRAVEQYNSDGNPVYFLSLGMTIVTDAPKGLRRPEPKKDKKATRGKL